MASFEIVELDSTGKPTPFPAGIFPDGQTAASIIATLSARYPDKKFQPRPIKDVTTDWRVREQKRFDDGLYQPLGIDLTPIKDHFAFKSLKVPTNVGYTAQQQDGVIDKQTSIHIRVYLTRFYPTLSVEEKRKIIWDYCGENITDGLHFATTPDAIQEVYTKGPGSCMSGNDFGFDEGMHPSRAYGAGDLAVAHFKDENGRITGRAVCWPAKKIYYNFYGDSAKLKGALDAEGFSQGRRDAFRGAKLLKIEVPDKEWDDYDEVWVDNGSSGYLCPYMDCADAVKVEGDFLVTCGSYDDGALDCHNTSGVVEY